jgi:cytochrome c oxidase subunit 3/cytochrome o ubiquinol oxidase subunit 3
MTALAAEGDWTLPDRGKVGVVCLIVTETALFSIFVVAYLFYVGTSRTGPSPKDVLDVPIWASVCLLSSSLTVTLAERALHMRRLRAFAAWVAVTAALGFEFLRQTALEWHHLIVTDHFTISTNLFGTTFYPLVGLHASHVIVGLALLVLVFVLSLRSPVMLGQSRRFQFLAWYWHFVDAVWIVVFAAVYVVGR